MNKKYIWILLLVGLFIMGSAIIFLLGYNHYLKSELTKTEYTEPEAAAQETEKEVAEETTEEEFVPSIGDVVRSGYFDVTVNRISAGTWVDTGNEFTDLKAAPGIAYLVLNITFKNIDTQDRTLFDGILMFYKDEQEYRIKKSETILAENWGIMLDNISPLTSKSTAIAYKIPSDLDSPVFWLPHGGDTWIHVGNLVSTPAD